MPISSCPLYFPSLIKSSNRCVSLILTPMSVVPLTLTVSLCLVFTFVLFFLREHSRSRFSSPESEALLPLADEMPRLAHGASSLSETKTDAASGAHSHGPNHVCHGNGSCSSCQRRAARESAQVAVGAVSHHA
jgi:hypothetical protein